MENEYYVYTHLNPTTKEVFYVGIGYDGRAWNGSAGRSKFWQNYANKYGFEVELIAENLTRKQAGKIEMELIAHLGRRQIDEGGTLVNRSIGGDGGPRGYTHTEEWKKLMSEKHTGKSKGWHHTEEGKAKIADGTKNRKITWYRPVLQYDKKGNFIKEWRGMKDAEKVTGAKAIWEVASGYKNGTYKSSGGYVWKFKE